MFRNITLMMVIGLVGIIYFFSQQWVKQRNVYWSFFKGAIIPFLFFMTFLIMGYQLEIHGSSGDEIAFYSIAFIAGIVLLVYAICVVIYRLIFYIKERQ